MTSTPLPRSLPIALFAIAALVLTMAPAAAQPRAGDCVIGPGLGATLLIPYFETDLTSFDGPATLVAVSNGLSTETLARVVLWTDWGIPTIAFDVYLPGFANASFNLRDIFNGSVPSTGAGVDLSGFDFCNSLPPDHANPALTAAEITQLRADHTGVSGPLAVNSCIGSLHPDDIATGYITIDVVDECSGVEGFSPFFTPANTSYPYFADGAASGIGINDNRLWGDVFYVSNDVSAAQGTSAVSLWADAALLTGDGRFTFYGRFSGFDGRDNRVPLPRLWNQRFINGGPFAGGAEMIVYHDPGQNTVDATCGDTPAPFPLGGGAAALQSDGTNLVVLNSEFDQVGGLVTQRSSVSDLSIPYVFGWLQIGTPFSQSWVQPTLTASGVYSAALDGTPAEFLCDVTPPAMLTTQSVPGELVGRSGVLSKAAQLKLKLKAEMEAEK